MIRKGQIYESCQPTFVMGGMNAHTRIKITGEPVTMHGLYGYGKVQVVTLTEDGREIRSRALEVSQLHATSTTGQGQPRRSGYRLVQDAEHSDA